MDITSALPSDQALAAGRPSVQVLHEGGLVVSAQGAEAPLPEPSGDSEGEQEEIGMATSDHESRTVETADVLCVKHLGGVEAADVGGGPASLGAAGAEAMGPRDARTR